MLNADRALKIKRLIARAFTLLAGPGPCRIVHGADGGLTAYFNSRADQARFNLFLMVYEIPGAQRLARWTLEDLRCR